MDVARVAEETNEKKLGRGVYIETSGSTML